METSSERCEKLPVMSERCRDMKRVTLERCEKRKKYYTRRPARFLPGDIIGCILSRLPIKSVVRFGCTSKFWSQIVSNNIGFQHSHFNRSLAAAPHIMIIARENDVITMSLSQGRVRLPCDASFAHLISTNNRALDYANNCNGLLCFNSPDDGSVLLCNPIIGELVALPLLEASAPPPPNYSVGLGFSPTTIEYKVVRLSFSRSNGGSTDQPADFRLTSAEVCTLQDSPACSLWRQVVRPPIIDLSPPHQKPLYLDGKMHWMMMISIWERGGSLLIWLQDAWITYDLRMQQQNNLPGDEWPISDEDKDWEMCHGYRMSLVSLKAKRSTSCDIIDVDEQRHIVSVPAQIIFARDLRIWSAMRSFLGHVIEKMGIVLKLLPGFTRAEPSSLLELLIGYNRIARADLDFARVEPSSVLGLLSRYTRAARVDRRLLGPHVYRTPQDWGVRGCDAISDYLEFDSGNAAWRKMTIITEIWLGKA